MANDITNILIIKGEENCGNFREICGCERNSELQEFSFNSIIPMPSELLIKSGSYSYMGDTSKYSEFREKDDSEKLEDLITEFLIENYNEEITQDEFTTKIINSTIKNPNFKHENITDSFFNEQSEECVDCKCRGYWNLKRYGYLDWYNWSIDKWGTKWDCYDCYVSDFGDSIKIEFNTAWSSPFPIFQKLAELKIEFTVAYADEDLGSNLGFLYTNASNLNQEELIILSCDINLNEEELIVLSCVIKDYGYEGMTDMFLEDKTEEEIEEMENTYDELFHKYYEYLYI